MPGSLSFENMRGLFNRDGYFFQQTLGRQLLTEPHSHDFYEMICLLSGSCVHIVNGFEVNCSEGDIFLLRPCDVHSFRDQGDGTNVAALSVAEPEVEQFITAYGFENDAVFDRQETPTEVPRTIVRVFPSCATVCSRFWKADRRRSAACCSGSFSDGT